MSQTNILLESGTNELELVEFFIDEGTDASGQTYRGYYGVNVAKVLEIIRMPTVTQLPHIPHPSVLGAFNLRSRIIPLVDLSLWLGKGTTEI
ncbi:MAG: chemotaxis protein CheV, partial [Desulfovibrio sp.]|nr:chemotaxis protein CheV [Desulfovibrio sp.]